MDLDGVAYPFRSDALRDAGRWSAAPAVASGPPRRRRWRPPVRTSRSPRAVRKPERPRRGLSGLGPGQHAVHAVDLEDADAIDSMVSAGAGRTDPIHILVNNAGGPQAPLLGASPEGFLAPSNATFTPRTGLFVPWHPAWKPRLRSHPADRFHPRSGNPSQTSVSRTHAPWRDGLVGEVAVEGTRRASPSTTSCRGSPDTPTWVRWRHRFTPKQDAALRTCSEDGWTRVHRPPPHPSNGDSHRAHVPRAARAGIIRGVSLDRDGGRLRSI